MSLVDALQWRYAAKRMNGKKVDASKIDSLLSAIQLSASGFGLQPYQILVIENQELKAKIRPAAYNQPQIVESSHLLVFAAWNEVTAEKINAFIQLVSETRNVNVADLKAYKDAIAGSLLSRPVEDQVKWMDKQVYLALGTALAAAAKLEIDSTPMEGFKPSEVDEILNLKEKGLHAVLMMAIGERDEASDFMVNAKKVRWPKEELFTYIV
ncbi:NAD(P)H-dependent oxidoreductase [Aquirufa nivalisilvae]|uniref:Oxygen-insensitive NAD(P)H nitroreductase n=1 Tax=Aquirufa nivalisilvae TaxID=2516557 RepID=A0A2S2DWZ3_9BACT|nr:nitroreductase family protein [Aquirufa nivalisilvae]AWL09550.1 Oxygen-insensitive NAD(P)H nitroreductase [Aquirufa nivalisilvae]MCZ2480905.1 NAD(P)H-dependent oxidoreductase [Aquirufa nivalisilvae]MCZ2483786.1 NAD(P)H-dependent oxidoreductase [Aquirufa nivalisilvae]